jgi:predicted kinase
MRRPFILISGLPASGKSRLAQRLSQPLNLPVIDKDNILEALFESKGIADAAWRRRLSRESDEILQREATAALRGAILASFWRVRGMPVDAGTPSSWVLTLSDQVLNVHCDCAPEVAAERFVQRQRHRGHLDETRSRDEVLASFRSLSALPHLDIPHRIHVDTSEEPTLDDVVRNVREILKALRP